MESKELSELEQELFEMVLERIHQEHETDSVPEYVKENTLFICSVMETCKNSENININT